MRTDLFGARQIEGDMAGHCGVLLRRDGRRPDGKIQQLRAEEESERGVAHGTTYRAATLTSMVHELFDTQAEKTPNALAVMDGVRELTYGS